MCKVKKIVNIHSNSSKNNIENSENMKDLQIKSTINNLNINKKNNRSISISKNFSEKDSEMKLKVLNNSVNTFRKSKNNKFRESSQSIRERIELTECTFKPKINSDKPEFSKEREKDIFERLHSEFDRINNRKLFKKLQRDLRESEIASFSPDLSCSSFRNSQYNKNLRHNSKKFLERLKDVRKKI